MVFARLEGRSDTSKAGAFMAGIELVDYVTYGISHHLDRIFCPLPIYRHQSTFRVVNIGIVFWRIYRRVYKCGHTHQCIQSNQESQGVTKCFQPQQSRPDQPAAPRKITFEVERGPKMKVKSETRCYCSRPSIVHQNIHSHDIAQTPRDQTTPRSPRMNMSLQMRMRTLTHPLH